MNNGIIRTMEYVSLLIELQKKYKYQSMFVLIISAFTIEDIKIHARVNNFLQLFFEEFHIKYICSKNELSYIFNAFKLLVDKGIFLFENNTLKMIPVEYEPKTLSNTQQNLLNELSNLSEESFIRMVINYV